jgi:peptidoglycan/LPS O-acetylase OafA/YrhL
LLETHSPLGNFQAVRTAYRPDIDGLRAVAVLSVLAYHYSAPFPDWLQLRGGFTGVDVFFVISGFLITSILSDEIEGGKFSVLGFYDRRIRRIVPALLVMLATTLVAGWFLLLPGDYKALADSAAYATFGMSNFFFLAHTGYFDQSADLLPLIHTWSLAVEEQFYLVWPIALFTILTGRGRNNFGVIAAIVVIALAGFSESLFWLNRDPKAAFFLATPRAWELVIGASLLFMPALPRRLGEIATAAGVTLIGIGFWTVRAESFPGFAALYPCIGAALVIWPRRTSTTAAAWLGYLSPIGLISYSLYLWHWPVWVMFRAYINNDTPRIREALALALLSIVLAVLSYRYVEQPFRQRRWPAAPNVLGGLAACILIYCTSMYVDNADGWPARISKDAYAMRSLDAMWEWPCKRNDLSPEIRGVCVFGAPWVDGIEKAVLWATAMPRTSPPFLTRQPSRRTSRSRFTCTAQPSSTVKPFYEIPKPVQVTIGTVANRGLRSSRCSRAGRTSRLSFFLRRGQT